VHFKCIVILINERSAVKRRQWSKAGSVPKVINGILALADNDEMKHR